MPEMCHSFPSAQNMSRESPANYQRQMSEPCLPYPQQGFKQEYHDPMYDQANHAGPSRAHRYPSSVVIKQEQTDYSYDSGKRPRCFNPIASPNESFFSTGQWLVMVGRLLKVLNFYQHFIVILTPSRWMTFIKSVWLHMYIWLPEPYSWPTWDGQENILFCPWFNAPRLQNGALFLSDALVGNSAGQLLPSFSKKTWEECVNHMCACCLPG